MVQHRPFLSLVKMMKKNISGVLSEENIGSIGVVRLNPKENGEDQIRGHEKVRLSQPH